MTPLSTDYTDNLRNLWICKGLDQRLLRRARGVVNYKRSLQRRILLSKEINSNGLSFEGSQIEGPQDVARCLVQVREGSKSTQHCVTRVANLHLQRVEGRDGCCFGCIDLKPEAERHGGSARWNRYCLEQRIGVRCAITVEPRVEGSGARRLSGGVGDHARGGGPINYA